jgi:hypothetical protein
MNPVIQKSTNPTDVAVRLFTWAESWIEDEALRQLYAAAKLEGMQLVAGFPDLHPGKGTPVGAAFVTDGVIYPHLLGGDMGCGMALFKTDLVVRDVKLDRWAQLPFDLEHVWTNEIAEGDRPGANPGILTKRKVRGERPRRLAYPQADSAQKSNPSPGTLISKPVFG